MKAITILQPWASLIACGAKKIETRSWATKYRGKIAIHAAKSCKAYHMNFAFQEPFYSALKNQSGCMLDQGPEGSEKRISYPLPGSVIAIADLVNCLKVTDWKIGDGLRVTSATLEDGQIITGNELEFGDYAPGRYAWMIKNVQAIKPIKAKGMQRLWEWESCPRYVEWPIGTKVKMVNCMEADGREEVVWTTRSNPWLLGHGEQVVLLENYSGGFATNCLEVVE